MHFACTWAVNGAVNELWMTLGSLCEWHERAWHQWHAPCQLFPRCLTFVVCPSSDLAGGADFFRESAVKWLWNDCEMSWRGAPRRVLSRFWVLSVKWPIPHCLKVWIVGRAHEFVAECNPQLYLTSVRIQLVWVALGMNCIDTSCT